VRLTGVKSGAMALLLVCLLATDYPATIAYFSNVRRVQTAPDQSQSFVVIDDAIWAHARADLSDLRLYDGQTQVPYALRERRAGVASVERSPKILNLGTIAGHTEFDLDTSDSDNQQENEYNRVQLQLTAKDFVAVAQVEGKNDVSQKQGARLGSSTVYDFSRENLGANSMLTMPVSSFRYLHIRLGSGISPKQLTGAVISRLEEKKAIWRDVGMCQPSATNADSRPLAGSRVTTLVCTAPTTVPVERVALQIPSARVNFRRNLTVTNSAGSEVSRGVVSRVRITRASQSVVSENLTVDLPSARSKQFTVTIENGDDAPLPVERVQLLSVERRLYFNPEGKTSLSLYYGDAKLSSPTYDYEQFFREDAGAIEARLGEDQHNPAYRGRSDDRPWSEQHKYLLWVAMILAVAVLLAVAARGLRSNPQT
jgi:hypothetical protein